MASSLSTSKHSSAEKSMVTEYCKARIINNRYQCHTRWKNPQGSTRTVKKFVWVFLLSDTYVCTCSWITYDEYVRHTKSHHVFSSQWSILESPGIRLDLGSQRVGEAGPIDCFLQTNSCHYRMVTTRLPSRRSTMASAARKPSLIMLLTGEEANMTINAPRFM